MRGKRNQPAYVTHTARYLAELRGESYEELERAVEATAAEVFGW
jgi:TatD DNase family protein